MTPLKEVGGLLGATAFEVSAFISTVIFSSTPLWPLSTSPKCFSVTNVFTTNISVKIMVTRLKGEI